MRKPLLPLCILALAAAACSGGADDGARQGTELDSLWNDAAALDSLARQITATRQALTFTGAYDDALVAAAGASATPAVPLAARMLVSEPAAFAREQAGDIIDGLLEKRVDARQARATINALHEAALRMRLDAVTQAFDSVIDAQALELDVNDQMRLFAAASTPQALGRALRADAARPGADLDLIKRQAEALRSIYNDAEYQQFLEAYQAK